MESISQLHEHLLNISLAKGAVKRVKQAKVAGRGGNKFKKIIKKRAPKAAPSSSDATRSPQRAPRSSAAARGTKRVSKKAGAKRTGAKKATKAKKAGKARAKK